MSKRLIALPVAMLAVAVFAPGIANAAQFKTTSTILITSTGKGFTGNVGSPATKCKNARKVQLQRKNQGAANFVNIGTAATTNSAGKWTISTNPVANAQYRVSVAQKKVGADTCKQGFSGVTTAKKTTSTIVQGPANFNGKVSSPSSLCVSGRRVNLQRKTIYQAAFQTIGSATTSNNGSWRVNTAVVHGASYRAQVMAKQVNTTSCMSGFSPVKVAS
jgi:hypothetical protein